jgi:hypothetical protein
VRRAARLGSQGEARPAPIPPPQARHSSRARRARPDNATAAQQPDDRPIARGDRHRRSRRIVVKTGAPAAVQTRRSHPDALLHFPPSEHLPRPPSDRAGAVPPPPLRASPARQNPARRSTSHELLHLPPRVQARTQTGRVCSAIARRLTREKTALLLSWQSDGARPTTRRSRRRQRDREAGERSEAKRSLPPRTMSKQLRNFCTVLVEIGSFDGRLRGPRAALPPPAEAARSPGRVGPVSGRRRQRAASGRAASAPGRAIALG